MTKNLRAYRCSNNLGVGAHTNLHGNLGWSKTNDNFNGFLEALRREHQGGTIGMGRTNGPPNASTTTITDSSSNDGSDMDLGGR